jgi:hypothetical protein
MTMVSPYLRCREPMINSFSSATKASRSPTKIESPDTQFSASQVGTTGFEDAGTQWSAFVSLKTNATTRNIQRVIEWLCSPCCYFPVLCVYMRRLANLFYSTHLIYTYVARINWCSS